jgi:hypothetical protein
MTDFTNFRSGQRDRQDATERGQWGERVNVDGAGSVMSVRGTGTVDEEVPIFNLGYSFNLSKDYNAEVIMLSLGGDVNNKIALPQLPRDKQHQWAENTGGIQHPTDASRRVEMNEDETFLRDGKFVVGSNREVTITVDGSNVTINVAGGGDLTFGGPLKITADDIDFVSGTLTHNGINVGDTHVHSQGSDSGGDTEVNTNGPQ